MGRGDTPPPHSFSCNYMIKLQSFEDIYEIYSYITNVGDKYKDFYITVEHKRKFLTEYKNLEHYFKFLKRGEIILGDSERGYLFTWGIADKSERKYIKTIFDNVNKFQGVLDLFVYRFSNFDWYIKVKKNNPIVSILPRYNFKILGDRGKEILYCYQGGKNVIRYC